MIFGSSYFQKNGKSNLSIIELQMPHFEVYEGGNVEFLVFKNSVSFAAFGPKKED